MATTSEFKRVAGEHPTTYTMCKKGRTGLPLVSFASGDIGVLQNLLGMLVSMGSMNLEIPVVKKFRKMVHLLRTLKYWGWMGTKDVSEMLGFLNKIYTIFDKDIPKLQKKFSDYCMYSAEELMSMAEKGEMSEGLMNSSLKGMMNIRNFIMSEDFAPWMKERSEALDHIKPGSELTLNIINDMDDPMIVFLIE